jgi:hypothetical protein
MRNHLISRIAAPGRRLAVFWGGSAGSSPSTASKPAALTQRQKAKYVDLRGIDDPLTALYWSRGEPIVIDVPLGNILNLGPLAFDCSIESGEPYVLTAREYAQGQHTSYAGSFLEQFYRHWAPRSAADVLGLEASEAPVALAKAPPHAFVYPWGSENLESQRTAALKAIEEENRRHGTEIRGEEGFKWHGPFSTRKGQLEFERLRLIIDSITTHGYQIELGIPNARLMMRGAEWRAFGVGGDHRRAVLAALGWSHAPIQFTDMVLRREDVKSWPNVQNGLFSSAQALRVFDRIFEGHQPVGCLPMVHTAQMRQLDQKSLLGEDALRTRDAQGVVTI